MALDLLAPPLGDAASCQRCFAEPPATGSVGKSVRGGANPGDRAAEIVAAHHQRRVGIAAAGLELRVHPVGEAGLTVPGRRATRVSRVARLVVPVLVKEQVEGFDVVRGRPRRVARSAQVGPAREIAVRMDEAASRLVEARAE